MIEARSAAAAAFLLELTAARLESDWGRFADLIEWHVRAAADHRTADASSSARGTRRRTRSPAAPARGSGCSASTRDCRIRNRPPRRRRIHNGRRRGT